MTVSSKIRIYDLAKELKLDTKRLIEEVRREGVDVSVPSNSVSKELAEKIRTKYFPKKETAVKRGIKVVKRAERAIEEPPTLEAAEVATEAPPAAEVTAPAAEPVAAAPSLATETPAAPPAPTILETAKQPVTSKLVRKRAPATRAEQPEVAETQLPPETEIEGELETADTNGGSPAVLAEATEEVQPATAAPSRQIRVLRPTVAALNAGIRPGERAPTPIVPPSITPRERAERGARLRERTPLAKTERLGTPGETATPQTTYIPPPDAGRRRSRRTPTRGGRKGADGKGGRFDRGDFVPPPKALSLEDRIAGRLEPGAVPGELKTARLIEGSTVKEFAEKLGIKPKDLS